MPYLESAVVIETKSVAEHEFISKFRAPKVAAVVTAGQFVMVSFPGSLDPLLPRAYSVSDVEEDCIKLYYLAIGKGSKRLSCLNQGEMVRLNGPLGNGFPVPSPGEEIWIVVGGSGAAILPIVTKTLKSAGAALKIFYGARSKAQICGELIESLAACNDDSVHYSTDDGTSGYHGTVVELVKSKLSPHPNLLPMIEGIVLSKIFGCGPTPMLVALQREFGKVIPTYLSVETPMACGMGLCQGCPVKISGQAKYLLACKDGPVFESQQIEFEPVGTMK